MKKTDNKSWFCSLCGIYLVITLMACTSETSYVETDLQKYQLHGSVKSIEETTKYVQSDEAELTRYMLFNAEGFLLKDSLNRGGDIVSFQFFYNSKGYISNRSMSQMSIGSEIKTEWQFTVDDNGRIIEERMLREGKKEEISKYFYNDDNQIRLIEIFLNGEHTRSVEKKYDVEQRLINSKVIRHGNIKDSTVLQVTYPSSNEKHMKDVSYDEVGRETVLYVKSEKFDNLDNVIETSFQTRSDKEASKMTFSYSFDERQNWVRKETRYADKPVSEVTTREIIYF